MTAVAPALSRVGQGRVRKLQGRAAADGVLAAEVAAFLPGPWADEDGDAVCRVGERWCRLSAEEISIGHERWPGSKRIPL